MSVKLTNWGTVHTGDAYTAPELRRLCLQGTLASGKRVTTSPVRGVPARHRAWSGLGRSDQGAVICKNDLLQRWAQW